MPDSGYTWRTGGPLAPEVPPWGVVGGGVWEVT